MIASLPYCMIISGSLIFGVAMWGLALCLPQRATTRIRPYHTKPQRTIYVWDFGDGNIGNGALVNHLYDAPGVYTAVVTASNQLNSLTATTLVTITSQPELLVELTAAPTLVGTGETVTYTLTLTNSGDVTLHDLSGVATAPGSFILPSSLTPGASISVSYGYTVLSADFPGPLTNRVTITATPTGGLPLTVTTAVAVNLKSYSLYIPMIINDSDGSSDEVTREPPREILFVKGTLMNGIDADSLYLRHQHYRRPWAFMAARRVHVDRL